jgi:sulfite exporter TauE/SafE
MQGILLGVGLGALGLAQVANATSLETMELISAGAMVVFLLLGAKVFANYRLIDSNGAASVEVRQTPVAQRA